MQSYEFITVHEDGVIRIPDDVIQKFGSRVKVTVENDERSDSDWNALFPPTVDTKSFRFDREEANERGHTS